MSSGWSMWTLRQGGRWRRDYRDGDGSLYLQWDSDASPIRDSNNMVLSRAVVELYQIPMYSTPRYVPASNEPSFSQSSNPTIGSGNNYEYASAMVARPNPPVQVSEDPGDSLGPLPITTIMIDAEKMSGKPSMGKEKNDLVSLQTTGTLRAGYVVQGADFFVLGKVFRVLWAEPMGTTSKDFKRDDDVYTALRPVVVVRKGPAQCTCVPIHSYGKQGVGKSGLTEYEVQQHAIIHMKGKAPRLVSAEQQWASKIKTKDAFTVDPVGNATFITSSRIRFDSPFTVKYNVKVLELGRVIAEHRPRLQERFRNAFK